MEVARIISNSIDAWSTHSRGVASFGQLANINYRKISSSVVCEYIPFFSAFANAHFQKLGNRRYNTYCLPKTIPRMVSSNKVQYFRDWFNYGAVGRIYRKGELNFYILKSTIYIVLGDASEDNFQEKVLLTLVIKSDYLFGETSPNFDSLDYSKLLLLVDNDFQNPTYRLMFNFVKKEVINPLVEAGVDIVYTNSIDKWCFRPVFEIPTFSTLSDRREYFSNLTNETLDELTGRERPREITVPAEATHIRIGEGITEFINREDLATTTGTGPQGELADGQLIEEIIREERNGGVPETVSRQFDLYQFRGEPESVEEGISAVESEQSIEPTTAEPEITGDSVPGGESQAYDYFLNGFRDAAAAGDTGAVTGILQQAGYVGGIDPIHTPEIQQQVAEEQVLPPVTSYTAPGGRRLSDEVLAGVFYGGSSANRGSTTGDSGESTT